MDDTTAVLNIVVAILTGVAALTGVYVYNIKGYRFAKCCNVERQPISIQELSDELIGLAI